MNLPNKLTLSRFIMAPIFLLSFFLFQYNEKLKVVCLSIMIVVYLLSELSDLLDGKIARKRNLVTDLGKVMDPFADTISHVIYFFCFMIYGLSPSWAFVIIMLREFSILFVRLLLAKVKGVSMSANIFGKMKTVFYAITTFLSILFIVVNEFFKKSEGVLKLLECGKTVVFIFYCISVFLSVTSFIIYIKDVVKSKALKEMTR